MFLTTYRRRPANELNRLHNEVNRMFDGVFGQGWPAVAANRSTNWPKVDVSDTDDAVHISAELPGLSQDQIDVEVNADTLRISGEKKDERVVDQHNFHSVERTFGKFERTVFLPAEVDSGNAEATFKDGVLTISLPKVKPVTPQKITVKPAS